MTEVKLKHRSEEDRLLYVLQRIAEFPYVGEKAAQQMRLLAEGALAINAAMRGCGDPNCKDPDCDYGQGPNRDPLSDQK